MTDNRAVELTDAERDEFLEDGGTGVMSFSTGTDESPHAIPVSYGYDAEENDFYFRFVMEADSTKVDLIDRPVTFTVYGQSDGEWVSVVAKGRLHETTEPEIASETLAGLERVFIPFVDIFGEPPADVPFGFYRLDPDELTAYRETPTEV
jgi:nitroimidazol reductase NimA-like FMN-containing flavoprotein (pyridoxamine 5'-phosphate oxidase superfamily)